MVDLNTAVKNQRARDKDCLYVLSHFLPWRAVLTEQIMSIDRRSCVYGDRCLCNVSRKSAGRFEEGQTGRSANGEWSDITCFGNR